MANTERGYDIIGNIAIVKFKRGVGKKEKKKYAEKFLREHKNVKTVLEKSEKFKGRLRTQGTKHIVGERTKEALYKENNCVFRLNVDSCYFSPRLSSERKEVGEMARKGEEVLVMFGGVGPFAIVIAKEGKAKRVVSVELGRECNKYTIENVKRNKLGDKIEIVQGDVRKVLKKWRKNEQFDRIIMARPNLEDSFLDVAFPMIRKKGIIHYYGFTENRKFSVPKTLRTMKRVSGYSEEDIEKLKELINKEAKRAGRKIKILKIKKAGDIGVKKYRYRIDFRVW